MIIELKSENLLKDRIYLLYSDEKLILILNRKTKRSICALHFSTIKTLNELINQIIKED